MKLNILKQTNVLEYVGLSYVIHNDYKYHVQVLCCLKSIECHHCHYPHFGPLP